MFVRILTFSERAAMGVFMVHTCFLCTPLFNFFGWDGSAFGRSARALQHSKQPARGRNLVGAVQYFYDAAREAHACARARLSTPLIRQPPSRPNKKRAVPEPVREPPLSPEKLVLAVGRTETPRKASGHYHDWRNTRRQSHLTHTTT